ncbi:MAG: ATPase [Mucilaginibacter sp.]|nr:ATPase [Mucilaginibacter sp.]
MENLTLKTAITFEAPISKVWNGLTDPAIVKQYFFGTNLISDWKVGSPITFSGEWEGTTYTDGGIILDIDPPRLLKYTYWSSMSGTEDKPENYNNITYELTEDGGVTTLVITQDGVKSREAMEHSENNWQSVFEGLKNILAEG